LSEIAKNTVHLHTLGCKLNYSETSMLSSRFVDKGFKLVEISDKPDIFILNTCSVTENADKECRQLIRSVLKNNPKTYVIITGCYAQLQPEEIAAIHGVDLVLGSNEKFRLFDYLHNFEKKEQSCIFTSPVDSITEFDYAYTSDSDTRTRAFLKIQDGCDYNCSFCTIPLARGRSRSLEINKVLDNAKHLIDTGYKEIVLTGVNTGDYDHDSKKFVDILYELDKLDIKRIRISSIEPNLLSDDIISLVRSSVKLCSHFHIPLQSGDNSVLKKMRRRYLREMYAELVSKLNEQIPDVGIGVDVIVGFPGESDDNFENTFDFLSSLNISYLHVFSYSERRNTDALMIPDKVDIHKRRKRSELLRVLSNKKKMEFYRKNTGKVMDVLFETVREDGRIYGFTDNYIRTTLNGTASGRDLNKLENKIIPVKIKSYNDFHHCIGDML
jgi:threonylcarbamoyladenosine tRNA methylthiotransferase MtaB